MPRDRKTFQEVYLFFLFICACFVPIFVLQQLCSALIFVPITLPCHSDLSLTLCICFVDVWLPTPSILASQISWDSAFDHCIGLDNAKLHLFGAVGHSGLVWLGGKSSLFTAPTRPIQTIRHRSVKRLKHQINILWKVALDKFTSLPLYLSISLSLALLNEIMYM